MNNKKKKTKLDPNVMIIYIIMLETCITCINLDKVYNQRPGHNAVYNLNS